MGCRGDGPDGSRDQMGIKRFARQVWGPEWGLIGDEGPDKGAGWGQTLA